MRWVDLAAHYSVFAAAVAWWLEGDVAWIPSWLPGVQTLAALLPVIPTIRAMGETNGVRRSLGIKRWLSYFLVWSLISPLLEILAPIIDWVPGYDSLPPFILVWLLLPMTTGASLIFEYLAPRLMSQHDALSSLAKRTESAMSDGVGNAGAVPVAVVTSMFASRKDTVAALKRANPVHMLVSLLVIVGCVVSIFIPGSVGDWFLMIVAFVSNAALPCFFSFKAISEIPASLPGSAHGGLSAASSIAAEHWLAFWMVSCVFSLISAVLQTQISFVPFAAQLAILVRLWLHFPLTFGSLRLASFVLARFRPSSSASSAAGASASVGGARGASGAGTGVRGTPRSSAPDEYDINAINARAGHTS